MRRRVRGRATVALTAVLALTGVGAGGWSLLPQTAGTAAAAPAVSWANELKAARDLGPSSAGGISLVAQLRSPHSAEMLSQWARRHGLRVGDRSGRAATITGSAPALQSALHVRIDDFRTPSGVGFTAALSDPRVPTALRAAVIALGRISSYAPAPEPATFPANVPAGGLTPSETIRAYNALPLVSAGQSGAKQTIVLFETDAFNQQSLDAFASKYHLPPLTVTVDGGNSSQGDEVESDMDIETIHAIAPGARIVYMDVFNFAPSPRSSLAAIWVAAIEHATQAYPGSIWSASLGWCEHFLTGTDMRVVSSAVARAEARGSTFYAASGDSGGLECTPNADWGVWPGSVGEGVSFPAVLPTVTGVGGTTLSVTSQGDYVGEAAWSMPTMSQGTGGGVSTIVARPAYQIAPGVAPNGVDARGREVPDVAADADNVSGLAVISAGASQSHNPDTATSGGGTSLATPIWAALTALMNGYLESHGGHAIGFINPLLYRFAAQPPKFAPFHDITLGSNDFFVAGPGYDLVTGVGSPNTANLTQDLLDAQTEGRR